MAQRGYFVVIEGILGVQAAAVTAGEVAVRLGVADRAGLASSLYKYLIDKSSIADAKKQLSFKYLHVSAGKTGILGHFWNKFEKAHNESGIEFWDWVDNVYQRDKLFDDFKPTPVGSWITDNLLKRE